MSLKNSVYCRCKIELELKLNIFLEWNKKFAFPWMLLKYMHFFHEISSQISTSMHGLYKDSLKILSVPNYLSFSTYLNNVRWGKNTSRVEGKYKQKISCELSTLSKFASSFNKPKAKNLLFLSLKSWFKV